MTDPMPFTWDPAYPEWQARRAAERAAKLAAQPMPDDLVPIALVPVEVFGGDCDCHEAAGHSFVQDGDVPEDMIVVQNHPGPVAPVVKRCSGWSYGLSDAVPSWSDCNRATGRIYRVDDTDPDLREPGDTIRIFVSKADLPWFEKRFGEQHGEGS